MARWVTECIVDRVMGFEIARPKCTCSSCGREALLKYNAGMDGSSYVYARSNFCPYCGESMSKEVQDTWKNYSNS